jgi:hypothetical protein
MRRATCLIVACLISAFASVARAETVELANGEILRGTVISLDAKTLKFQSESLGEVSIAREKIAFIQLQESVRQAALPATRSPIIGTPTVPPPPVRSAPDPSSLDGLLRQLQSEAGGKPITPDDLLKQLQDGKSAELDEIKKNLPLFAAPEVQDYFRKQVGGLLDGSITVNDVRQEAIRARDETKAAVKELGPDAEKALAPYLGILERFIRESEPKATPAAPPTLPVPATTPPK